MVYTHRMFQLNSLFIVLENEEGDEKSTAPQTRYRLSKDSTKYLEGWLLTNLCHPYPTSEKKKEMMSVTGQTRKQIEEWFENRRRPDRLEKLKDRNAHRPSMDSGNRSAESIADPATEMAHPLMASSDTDNESPPEFPMFQCSSSKMIKHITQFSRVEEGSKSPTLGISTADELERACYDKKK